MYGPELRGPAPYYTLLFLDLPLVKEEEIRGAVEAASRTMLAIFRITSRL